MSDYAKNKLSERRRNIKVSDETKNKLKESSSNRKYINNGIINKRIRTEELIDYINQGWVLGVLKTEPNPKNKRIYIHKNDTQKLVRIGALPKYLEEGWLEGKL